jgi:hypothetical protein
MGQVHHNQGHAPIPMHAPRIEGKFVVYYTATISRTRERQKLMFL